VHSVRLASFTLGLWLAGGLFMAWMATQNFRGVDRLLAEPNPAARLAFRTLDGPNPGAARLLLRYQVSEQNRFYFESWEIAQILLGSLLLFFMLFGTREDKYSLAVVLLLLILVAVQRFFLTPEVIAIGRTLDFVPPDGNPAERARFWLLHNAYSGVELLKWALTLLIAGRFVVGRHRSRSGGDVRKQLDMIDKANHRHVDR
jgi:hypothetical protein